MADIPFNPGDFEQIEVKIAGENNTSKLRIKKSPKCEIVELADKEILLQMPAGSCAVGHYLNLNVKAEYQDQSVDFSSTMVVLNVEKQEARDSVRTQLIQYDHSNWSAFRKLFQRRQDEILVLFSKIKGRE